MNPVDTYSSRSMQNPTGQSPVESTHDAKEAKQKSEEKGLCPGIIDKISGFFATFCKHSSRTAEVGFTYPKGEYFSTIKTHVEAHDEKKLRTWLKEYSAYRPSQILFGKYFISIEMIQNYMVSLLKSENVQKTDGEIREAVNKFVGNQHRRLLQILHPDKHAGSEFDLKLLDECAKLIRDATDKLEKELAPIQN